MNACKLLKVCKLPFIRAGSGRGLVKLLVPTVMVWPNRQPNTAQPHSLPPATHCRSTGETVGRNKINIYELSSSLRWKRKGRIIISNRRKLMTKELKHTKQVMHDGTAHWPVPTQFLSSSPQPASPSFITECLVLERTSGNPLMQPPANVGSGAVCTRWCPGESRAFPEKETPQPLWAACCSAQSALH